MPKYSLTGYDRVTLARKGCKRCGSKSVAWRESKAGHWYLIEVFDFDGELRAHYKDFHSGYCGHPELHQIEQRVISNDLGIEDEEEAKISVVVEERKAADSAKFFLALHDLCKSNPHLAREGLTARQVALTGATERERKQLQAEINFMEAALGMSGND